MIFVFSIGDELYPKSPDYEGTKKSATIAMTLKELGESTIKQNRFNMRGLHDCQVVCNIEQDCHQLCPMVGQRMIDYTCKQLQIETITKTSKNVNDILA